MKIETIEISGFASTLKALRLPHNLPPRSVIDARIKTDNSGAPYIRYGASVLFDTKDVRLMQTLQKKGDQHAKALRGLIAYCEITAPTYFFVELETYRIGHERLSSTSTMHAEGKGLTGEELQCVKAEIPMGREMTKIDYFSYPTLRRIYYQRHNHRLPEWHTFCEWIKTLPFTEEFILCGLSLDNGD